MKIQNLGINIIAICLVSGCATHEIVTVEKKPHGVTIVHHRSRTSNGARDKIEAISAKGVVTQAVVEVYDIGRLPDGHGGMTEAHQYYRARQTPSYDLRLPRKSGTKGTGHRTVYTPPNYSPMPNDQRVNDAVTEANKAKEKMLQTQKDVESRLQEDNNLRGQLQTALDQNQALQDQLNAAMNTPSHASASPTPMSQAAKAAQNDMDQLTSWANKQQ